jgi:8-oxo-dGTP pyrophosphatase MutT (NUDIX family)
MDKEKVYRAGVIPFYVEEGEIKMLFMQPSDPKFGGEHFQVAKGKQEEGETDKETAFREAGEELGLFNGNIIEKHDLGNFLGRTRIFLAEIEDPNMFGDPDFETGAVKWLTLNEFKDIGRDLHKPIVKAAVRCITDKKNLN